MAKMRLSEPLILASCRHCRTLVSVDENGRPIDPIYGRRSRVRAMLEKARADGPPRQVFADGWNSLHWCTMEAVAAARKSWDERNQRHPWDSLLFAAFERRDSGARNGA